MSVPVRRVLYSLIAALGFGLMVPFAIRVRLWSAEFSQAGLDVETLFDPARQVEILGLFSLAFVGLVLATAFLYAALSAGDERVWRPREDGRISCRRCGAELAFGIRRCPSCEQHLAW